MVLVDLRRVSHNDDHGAAPGAQAHLAGQHQHGGVALQPDAPSPIHDHHRTIAGRVHLLAEESAAVIVLQVVDLALAGVLADQLRDLRVADPEALVHQAAGAAVNGGAGVVGRSDLAHESPTDHVPPVVLAVVEDDSLGVGVLGHVVGHVLGGQWLLGATGRESQECCGEQGVQESKHLEPRMCCRLCSYNANRMLCERADFNIKTAFCQGCFLHDSQIEFDYLPALVKPRS